MQILVTGARGKVGAATIHDLIEAGHRVTGCDLAPPVYEGGDRGAHYIQADLTDPGDAFSVVRGQDVVIHCAALPEPTRNAPDKVF
jgi:nucleoside-diphosphate-sugar epimerase